MRLLLHSCCAPCSGAIIESLAKDFRAEGRDPSEAMAIFWSNSNICDRQEYDKRRCPRARPSLPGVLCVPPAQGRALCGREWFRYPDDQLGIFQMEESGTGG